MQAVCVRLRGRAQCHGEIFDSSNVIKKLDLSLTLIRDENRSQWDTRPSKPTADSTGRGEASDMPWGHALSNRAVYEQPCEDLRQTRGN